MGILSWPWYLQAFTALALLGIVYFVRYSRIGQFLPKRILTYGMIRRQGEKHGCKAPYRPSDWTLGIGRMRAQIKANKEHRGLERAQRVFTESGSYTHGRFFLGRYLVITADPANIQSVLATDFHSFGLEPLRKVFTPLLGVGGIFNSDGEVWKHSRASLRPSFSRDHISDVTQFEPHVKNLLARIPRDATTIDLAPLFYDLAMDISTEFMFGESTAALTESAVSPEVTRFVQAWNGCMESFSEERNKRGVIGMFFEDTSFSKNCQIVHEFLDKLIAKNIAAIKKNGSAVSDTFLGGLLEHVTDPLQIRTECANVLLAGRDTTSAILGSLFHTLSQRPDIQKRLRDEIAELPNPPSYDDLKDLKYLRAFINEGLRCFPLLPQNAREALQDSILPSGGGPDGKDPVFVPRGALVGYSTWVMHRRKDLYGEDADEFKPERWLDTHEKKGIRPGWAYIPFNGGPRICIGQQFAITEVSYVVVRLLQELPAIESRDPEPWRELLLITLSSLNGCKIAVPDTKS